MKGIVVDGKETNSPSQNNILNYKIAKIEGEGKVEKAINSPVLYKDLNNKLTGNEMDEAEDEDEVEAECKFQKQE